MQKDQNISKSRAQDQVQTKSSWVIQHQQHKKKPMYALVQCGPMECQGTMPSPAAQREEGLVPENQMRN